jgi:hydrogenase expression/formation protein HypD
MFEFRDKKIARKIISKLRENDRKIMIMHVCGTHQDTLIRYGLQDLLNPCNIEIRQGPGCPVCITTSREIEEAITLAKKGIVVASYGDMIPVPGKNDSLQSIRAKGGEVYPVYSIEDAVELARDNGNKEVVFMAVGFETTAPSTAATMLNKPPKNFSILCCHRTIPPAVEALLEMGEIKIDGLIQPGHVSTIIGIKPYREIEKKHRIAQVIAGFEPLDVLTAVTMIYQQIKGNSFKVENEYIRSVREEGNTKALSIMREVFKEGDVEWRGFPVIPKSGLSLKEEFSEYDARKKFEDKLEDIEVRESSPPGCGCGEVLRGVIRSQECSLFGKACTPDHPVGPCMVSREGSCYIEFRYAKRNR